MPCLHIVICPCTFTICKEQYELFNCSSPTQFFPPSFTLRSEMHHSSHTYNLYSSLTVPSQVSKHYKNWQYRVLFISVISFVNRRRVAKRYETTQSASFPKFNLFLTSLQFNFMLFSPNFRAFEHV